MTIIPYIILAVLLFGLFNAYRDFKSQIGWLHRRLEKLEKKVGISEKETQDLL